MSYKQKLKKRGPKKNGASSLSNILIIILSKKIQLIILC